MLDWAADVTFINPTPASDRRNCDRHTVLMSEQTGTLRSESLIENAKCWSFNYNKHGLCLAVPAPQPYPLTTSGHMWFPDLSLSLSLSDPLLVMVLSPRHPPSPASQRPEEASHGQQGAQGQDTGGHKSVASPSIPQLPLTVSLPPHLILSTTQTHRSSEQ